ncbi:class I SAM-dependent DNA methyltransferase [Bradyrhizobium sp.]|jgi:type II restriction/modification system DNA methylase subunit YeeA|uniref:class I SAM-dependent DNA methyltransferase n=1 Tax=Bradyrhizobium sp. TaxID=376 RepID=UPI002DFC191F|nr:DNA methyltransferase [Bradyrhizobium sp.]
MDVHQFIDKWARADRTERQAAQEHFIDLCRVLGEPTPNEAADPGAYSFEKGASKIDGSPGFADVWKRGHFGWEYKKDRANLDRAYQQLQLYSVALENPPLLVVSDTKRFRIYTNWTNTVQTRHEFVLEDLARSGTRELLKNVFNHPDRLKPDKTREQVTKDAAKEFTTIAERLRMSGHAPEKVAHFLNRLVFCLFAEDVNLLENDLFKRMLDNLAKRRDRVAEQSQRMFTDLFREMRRGGNYGLEHILHFNGGLFDDDTALPLDADSLDILRNIARLDWSAIDPSIFGTLFERFLDPDKRAQIGAHYTDPEKIMMIVNPVIVRPLTAEWEAAKGEIADVLSRSRGKPGKAVLDRAEARLDTFVRRLDDVRILDPACGSGNFLYLALQSLKDLEYRAIVEAEAMGLARRVVHCGPHNVKGIEINPYAAELARTAIWIGNIQWLRRNGFEARKEPVLEDLNAIECRDALVTKMEDGSYEEAQWPDAEFIVGNPPFLGDKVMIAGLGERYVDGLRSLFSERVRGGADLVMYWFEKARAKLVARQCNRVGFVATNSIRAGANRNILEHIKVDAIIFEAWSDEPWIVEGAAVRVSIVCFSTSQNETIQLDGGLVPTINADLSSAAVDLTKALVLPENANIGFIGTQKGGPFEIDGQIAREWLRAPLNANGRNNSEVVRPWANGMDIVRRSSDTWIVDFGVSLSESDSSFYELPFEYVRERVKPLRMEVRREGHRRYWWRHAEARPGMRTALKSLKRFLVTPRVAKHRLFVLLSRAVVPDTRLVVIAREDDTSLGVLLSKFHEAWSLRTCSWHGVGNDPTYNAVSCFETFPFPEGLTPNIPASAYADNPHAIAIAIAAKRLDELRNAWLNPPDLVDIVPEVVPGYPDRILPKTEEAAAILKKRTLTNLYNQRPQWLADAHRDLDAAVAAAYGWPADISEEDALAKLLELNLSRASAGAAAARDDSDDGDADTPGQATAPRLTRAEFAKISEVEGLRLSKPMQQAFADFDRRGLSAEERRQAIIDRFKHTAK